MCVDVNIRKVDIDQSGKVKTNKSSVPMSSVLVTLTFDLGFWILSEYSVKLGFIGIGSHSQYHVTLAGHVSIHTCTNEQVKILCNTKFNWPSVSQQDPPMSLKFGLLISTYECSQCLLISQILLHDPENDWGRSQSLRAVDSILYFNDLQNFRTSIKPSLNQIVSKGHWCVLSKTEYI